MGGICGILHLDRRPVDRDLLIRMMNRMAHRGPDGQGCWIHGPVGFGCRLLSTTPESLREKQPFHHSEAQRVAVLDGRLDNREELQGILQSENGAPPRQTDVELLLAADQRWGRAAAKHLLGDFAFATWDYRHRRLFLARDPIGVKPLYYYCDGRRLLFSSEISPFFEDPSIPRKPHESMIAQYLVGGFQSRGATFFQGIQQLPPAHTLSIAQEGKPRMERYWHPDSARLPCYCGPREDDLERFQEIFKTAVGARLRSASVVGILLSGGLDSTQIAATAEHLRSQQHHRPSLHAVTLLTEGFLQEEWDALKRLERAYGTSIDVIRTDKGHGLESPFELHLDSGETPHPDGFPALPSLLKVLQSKGCKAILTGFGANELGYLTEFGFLQDLLLSLRLRRLAREARGMARATLGQTRQVLRAVWDETFPRMLPFPVRWLARQWKNSGLSWMKQETRRALPSRPVSRSRRFPTLCQDNVYRALTGPSFCLELNQMDHLTARFSLEARHPFLDRRVIEFFLSTPSEVKMRDGYRKMFVQKALQAIVPGPLRQTEEDRYFTPELEREKRRQLEVARLGAYLSSPEAMIYQYVNYPDIQAMRRLNQKEWRLFLPFLWRLAILEHWLKRFFHRNESTT